jgi:sulfur-oxidizing protein SoxY
MAFNLVTSDEMVATSLSQRVAKLTTSESIMTQNMSDGHAEMEFRRPSHSGMQMDQISLLFIPARYIETVEVFTDDVPMFSMTGSISLSEDPAISFPIPLDAQALTVRMVDTEEAEFKQTFPLNQF